MEAQYATEVREARPEDVGAIRRIARSSLEASYSDLLSVETVSEAVAVWYGNDRFQYRLSHPDNRFLVAQSGSELTGFSESAIEADGAVGAINWLHVDPYHRGQGTGSQLLEATEDTLLGDGALRIEGRVLAANEAGNEFYRAHGYTPTGNRTIDIAGTEVTENRYIGFPDRETIDGLLEPVEKDGKTVYVALDERERGTIAPFYMVYTDRERESAYGYCCANCECLAVTMNTMGRMECGDCENRRSATRWDAAYL